MTTAVHKQFEVNINVTEILHKGYFRLLKLKQTVTMHVIKSTLLWVHMYHEMYVLVERDGIATRMQYYFLPQFSLIITELIVCASGLWWKQTWR
jgi:hypothetical protein